jgi:hypothetical protein
MRPRFGAVSGKKAGGDYRLFWILVWNPFALSLRQAQARVRFAYRLRVQEQRTNSGAGPEGERQDGASYGERHGGSPFMVRYLTTNG